LRRLRLVLSTELSEKNKIQAIGSLAVPVLGYSFGIINWRQEELQKLDRKTRKLLTIHVLCRSHIIDMCCVLLFFSVYSYTGVLMLHAVFFNYCS